MELAKPQKRALLNALAHLQAGDAARFEDLLWLGFGDEWRAVRRRLAGDQFISENGTIRLTARGLRLVERLRGELDEASQDGADARPPQ